MTNLFRTNRMVFFAPGTPDKPASMEVAGDIPKADELTQEHIEKVLKAVDKNIKTIEDYYNKDYFTKDLRGEKMPEEIKTKLAQLKKLKTELEKVRFNPPASRDVLVKIYDIFTDLDEHTEKTIEDAKKTSDPLKGLGIIAGIYRPLLTTEQPEAKPADTRVAETKEQSQEKLVLAAVENIAKAGGVLTQDMLDALKSYKPNVSPLRFDFMIEANPLTLFVERSADGFAVMGLKKNTQIQTPSEGSSWDKAFFRESYSYTAGSNNPPNIPLKTQEEYIAMVEKNKLPPEKLA